MLSISCVYNDMANQKSSKSFKSRARSLLRAHKESFCIPLRSSNFDDAGL